MKVTVTIPVEQFEELRINANGIKEPESKGFSNVSYNPATEEWNIDGRFYKMDSTGNLYPCDIKIKDAIKQEMKPAFDDTCKAFESLAYGLTRMSEKLSKAIDAGIEKANDEKLCEELSMKDFKVTHKHSAPDWVIEMMKTGKPVKCIVNGKYEDVITGYDIVSRNPYKSCKRWLSESLGREQQDETYYNTAKPITEWKPQIGDAVFANYQTRVFIGTIIHNEYPFIAWKVKEQSGRIYSYGKADIKPFDASKIGKPWSEI